MALPDPVFTPQTELDAVNQMLGSIGFAPVNSLDVQGIKDVGIARLTLHNTSREVQSRGWWFNTDKCYPIAPNGTGEILRPANALSFDPTDKTLNYVERDGKFYDKDNRTSVIGESVECNLVWFFEFETLPQEARAYIAHKAGRVFQAQSPGSTVMYQFTKEREQETLADLNRRQLKSADSNIFRAPTSTARIVYRRR
jgi:hypothetical protein